MLSAGRPAESFKEVLTAAFSYKESIKKNVKIMYVLY